MVRAIHVPKQHDRRPVVGEILGERAGRSSRPGSEIVGGGFHGDVKRDTPEGLVEML